MKEYINILCADGITKQDAKKYMDAGQTIIYERPEDYIDTLKGNGLYNGETLEQARDGVLTDISIVKYDGHEYLIEYGY